MKFMNDDFPDYFEKKPQEQGPKPHHEETPEEREERELIETTIERRSNKKRIFMAVGTLVVLLLLIFLVRDRYFHVYQEKDVKGRISDVALRGSMFKTYEATMLVYDVVAQGNVVKEEFNFTVVDDSIASTLGRIKQTPIAVQVHYKEYKSSVPWRGDTKYIATAIDTVDINAYTTALKTIPVPAKPKSDGDEKK